MSGIVLSKATLAAAKRRSAQDAESRRDMAFRAALSMAGIPDPEREFRFVETRRFRFDYAWPAVRMAVEVEGGIFMRGGGRHNRGAYMLTDMEKYNLAAENGWTLLRYTPQQVISSEAVGQIYATMRRRQATLDRIEDLQRTNAALALRIDVLSERLADDGK